MRRPVGKIVTGSFVRRTATTDPRANLGAIAAGWLSTFPESGLSSYGGHPPWIAREGTHPHELQRAAVTQHFLVPPFDPDPLAS